MCLCVWVCFGFWGIQHNPFGFLSLRTRAGVSCLTGGQHRGGIGTVPFLPLDLVPCPPLTWLGAPCPMPPPPLDPYSQGFQKLSRVQTQLQQAIPHIPVLSAPSPLRLPLPNSPPEPLLGPRLASWERPGLHPRPGALMLSGTRWGGSSLGSAALTYSLGYFFPIWNRNRAALAPSELAAGRPPADNSSSSPGSSSLGGGPGRPQGSGREHWPPSCLPFSAHAESTASVQGGRCPVCADTAVLAQASWS